jgi:hypothetical protein
MIIYTEADFEIRPSTIKGAGMGLFSRVDIELEETIGYYTGEVITEAQLFEESTFADQITSCGSARIISSSGKAPVPITRDISITAASRTRF